MRVQGQSRVRHAVLAAGMTAAFLCASGCTQIAVSVLSQPTMMGMARALGTDVVRSLVRGYVPGRSGELALIPKPWNVLSTWVGFRGEGDPRTSHSWPWAYFQRVPLVLYGPGYIREDLRVDRPVTSADIAPTLAELLDLPFETDGRVLNEALRRPGTRTPPRAIVVVVMDGGGWNVLDQWPRAWPAERRLMLRGTNFVNATTGSAPPVTATVHATIGTGAFPKHHGIPDNSFRQLDGTVRNVYLDGSDIETLRVPTLADRWDRSTGNRSWVGMFGYVHWHLGMMGTGGYRDGADKDVAVLWDQTRATFQSNEDFYVLPDHLPSRSVLDSEMDELDASDGARDGFWMGHSLDPTSTAFTSAPAFANYAGGAAASLLQHEPIGDDAVTDLLFVELKSGDLAGHTWNMTSLEFKRTWRAQDRALGSLLRQLDDSLGSGRYVLALTADHGQSPLPEAKGGLRINRSAVQTAVNARFGDIVETVGTADLHFKPGVAADVDPEAIARFISDLTYADVLPYGLDPATVPQRHLQSRVFAAALPGSFLESLSAEEIDRLGPGLYPEGDLTTPPRMRSLAGLTSER